MKRIGILVSMYVVGGLSGVVYHSMTMGSAVREWQCIGCFERRNRSPDGRHLPIEHFFDLSDLFLNFAGVFFGVAFGL